MNFKTGFWGFILGGLTGAIVALLVAPQSGDETRQLLIENSQKMRDNAIDSIQEAQEIAVARLNEAQIRVETINKETKELLTQLQDIGKSTLEEQKEALEDGYEQAKEVTTA